MRKHFQIIAVNRDSFLLAKSRAVRPTRKLELSETSSWNDLSRQDIFAIRLQEVLPIALTNLYGRQVPSSRTNCLFSLSLSFFIQRTLAADHTRRGKCVVSSLYFERKYYRNAVRASAPANILYTCAPLPRARSYRRLEIIFGRVRSHE